MHHPTITSRLTAAPYRRWAMPRLTAWAGTIRGRILLAFLVMSLITVGLGGYAALGIVRAGVLVSKTFDESLMSINYARAAAADFAGMRAAFARRWIGSDPAMRDKLDQKFETLEQSLTEDLAIAAERSQSMRAAQAAANVLRAARAWSEGSRQLLDDGRRQLIGGRGPDGGWEALDRNAATVDQQIDLLVNYTAGDGFMYRQQAHAVVISDLRLYLGGTVLALLLSALVAWFLTRRIIGPVAAASAAAERIARGQLDGVIPRGADDELGNLLAAMNVMRDNIRTMMEREVAQRRSAQARLADALESSREGVVLVDAEGRIALANSQAANFLGSSLDLLRPGTPIDTFICAGSAEGGTGLLRPDASLPATGEAHLADGRWLRVSQSATQEGGFVTVWSDITVLKDQEAKLKATNLRLDAALDNMSQGLCLYDADSRLQVANRRFCEIFRLPMERVNPGLSYEDVLELSVAVGNHSGQTAAELLDLKRDFFRQRPRDTRFEQLAGGRVIAITRRPIADGGWVSTFEDVTERRQSEDRIVFMARHDVLTSLPNRMLFVERIEDALLNVVRDGSFAVLCLDLDQFKQVNDTLGHPVGDELLRAVAQRLKACVRDADTVARLGGDEFAIVQRGIARPEDAAVLARRIVDVVGEPYDIDGHRVTVGVSIGISLAPGDDTVCGKLLKNADVALYRAKADGRGIWRFFEAEMDARLQARRALELDLREALANDEFELFYQPIYDLHEERLVGFEALLRWLHPIRGMVAPADFIGLAEEIGLIVPLGEWVLRTACAQARHWPDDVKLAVNVSATQFKNAPLLQIVTDALAAAGIAARRLELEITETVLLVNSAANLATLHTLRNLGVHISMDDFGTGYSSLSYLRSFPFDKIKIDRSFVQDLAAANGAGVIVRAITSLAHSLGMRTTAEGVETYEQLARLRTEGCDEVQGYLFSVPVAARSTAELLDRWNGASRAVA